MPQSQREFWAGLTPSEKQLFRSIIHMSRKMGIPDEMIERTMNRAMQMTPEELQVEFASMRKKLFKEKVRTSTKSFLRLLDRREADGKAEHAGRDSTQRSGTEEAGGEVGTTGGGSEEPESGQSR